MELVQPPQMVQQCFQRLGDRKELQEAMDDDVEDGQEAQAHVAKVDGQVLGLERHGGVDLVRKTLEVQLLRVFLVKGTNIADFRSGYYTESQSDDFIMVRMEVTHFFKGLLVCVCCDCYLGFTLFAK